MGFPFTINGRTYTQADFAPYGYVTAFPDVMSDMAAVLEDSLSTDLAARRKTITDANLTAGNYDLLDADHGYLIRVNTTVATVVRVSTALRSGFLCTVLRVGTGAVSLDDTGSAVLDAFRDWKTLEDRWAEALIRQDDPAVATHFLASGALVA